MIFNECCKDIIHLWNECNRHVLIRGRGKESRGKLSTKIINYMNNEGFSTLILIRKNEILDISKLNSSLKLWFAPYFFIPDFKEPLTIDLLVIEDAAEIPHDFISRNIIWKNILIISDYENKIPPFFSGEIIHLGD